MYGKVPVPVPNAGTSTGKITANIGTVRSGSNLGRNGHDALFASVGKAQQGIKSGLGVLFRGNYGPLPQFPHPDVTHFLSLKNKHILPLK